MNDNQSNNPSSTDPTTGQPFAPGTPFDPGARQLNDLLTRFARPFLTKCLTRLVTWGATAICGYLALSAPDANWTTQAAATAAGMVCLIAATTIDRWHHKTDTSR